MSTLLKVTDNHKLLKIGFIFLITPICAFGIWIALLMFGIVFSDVSAHNMEPMLPFGAQLVNVNRFGGAEAQTEVKTYYTSAAIDQVLAVMEKQRGTFTKLIDMEGHEIFSNMRKDQSLSMQIVSQSDVKDGIPGTFPSVEIRIQSGRGIDPTGTTIVVVIDVPT